jgi:hypothetical protein
MADRRRKQPTIRYRTPAADGPPPLGCILMGDGPRARRAYRVLGSVRCRGVAAVGIATFRLSVEPMSVTRGREEVAAGAEHWLIFWDRRKRNAPP